MELQENYSNYNQEVFDKIKELLIQSSSNNNYKKFVLELDKIYCSFKDDFLNAFIRIIIFLFKPENKMALSSKIISIFAHFESYLIRQYSSDNIDQEAKVELEKILKKLFEFHVKNLDSEISNIKTKTSTLLLPFTNDLQVLLILCENDNILNDLKQNVEKMTRSNDAQKNLAIKICKLFQEEPYEDSYTSYLLKLCSEPSNSKIRLNALESIVPVKSLISKLSKRCCDKSEEIRIALFNILCENSTINDLNDEDKFNIILHGFADSSNKVKELCEKYILKSTSLLLEEDLIDNEDNIRKTFQESQSHKLKRLSSPVEIKSVTKNSNPVRILSIIKLKEIFNFKQGTEVLNYLCELCLKHYNQAQLISCFENEVIYSIRSFGGDPSLKDENPKVPRINKIFLLSYCFKKWSSKPEFSSKRSQIESIMPQLSILLRAIFIFTEKKEPLMIYLLLPLLLCYNIYEGKEKEIAMNQLQQIILNLKDDKNEEVDEKSKISNRVSEAVNNNQSNKKEEAKSSAEIEELLYFNRKEPYIKKMGDIVFPVIKTINIMMKNSSESFFKFLFENLNNLLSNIEQSDEDPPVALGPLRVKRNNLAHNLKKVNAEINKLEKEYLKNKDQVQKLNEEAIRIKSDLESITSEIKYTLKRALELLSSVLKCRYTKNVYSIFEEIVPKVMSLASEFKEKEIGVLVISCLSNCIRCNSKSWVEYAPRFYTFIKQIRYDLDCQGIEALKSLSDIYQTIPICRLETFDSFREEIQRRTVDFSNKILIEISNLVLCEQENIKYIACYILVKILLKENIGNPIDSLIKLLIAFGKSESNAFDKTVNELLYTFFSIYPKISFQCSKYLAKSLYIFIILRTKDEEKINSNGFIWENLKSINCNHIYNIIIEYLSEQYISKSSNYFYSDFKVSNITNLCLLFLNAISKGNNDSIIQNCFLETFYFIKLEEENFQTEKTKILLKDLEEIKQSMLLSNDEKKFIDENFVELQNKLIDKKSNIKEIREESLIRDRIENKLEKINNTLNSLLILYNTSNEGQFQSPVIIRHNNISYNNFTFQPSRPDTMKNSRITSRDAIKGTTKQRMTNRISSIKKMFPKNSV